MVHGWLGQLARQVGLYFGLLSVLFLSVLVANYIFRIGSFVITFIGALINCLFLNNPLITTISLL